MTSIFRHAAPSLIEHALTDARRWRQGHIIDDRPAHAHATQVATTLITHQPDTRPHLIAALLHDSPDFVPAGSNLDSYLTNRYSPETTRDGAANRQVTESSPGKPAPVRGNQKAAGGGSGATSRST
ncbi:hypothetical protein [Catenuloplanes nepalensis]|uniref:hypothetical protein n=1 Tax=Catenuloplanes nepalensis TaxID=587533 RepID=UPI0027D7C6C9|nr:hypothetical protein [Catenuloplanes nepalensis]